MSPPPVVPRAALRWQDGERLVVFGRGALGQGDSNAIMLPHAMAALSRRSPERMALLGRAVGGARGSPGPARGAGGLSGAGVADSALRGLAERAARRPELAMRPPAADRLELLELLRAAF